MAEYKAGFFLCIRYSGDRGMERKRTLIMYVDVGGVSRRHQTKKKIKDQDILAGDQTVRFSLYTSMHPHLNPKFLIR